MKTVLIKDKEFVINGFLCRTIRLKEEWDEDILNPEEIIEEIKRNKIKADILTFWQRLPDLIPRFDYFYKMDNVAALHISTYENWWTRQAFKQVRKNVRRAEKRGFIVKRIEFNDDLVKGIHEIYNETRIRQGKLNRHYGKSIEETKSVNITYLDRSDFIGAYKGNELVGFIKLVYTKTKSFARTMGIEGKIKYRGSGYMHALIAKAVELCATKKIPYIIYGKFVYGTKGPDSVTMFKMYNGFEKVDVPRYYIPVSLKGNFLLKVGLYKNIRELLPGFLIRIFLKIRKLYYETRYRKDFKAEKKFIQAE